MAAPMHFFKLTEIFFKNARITRSPGVVIFPLCRETNVPTIPLLQNRSLIYRNERTLNECSSIQFSVFGKFHKNERRNLTTSQCLWCTKFHDRSCWKCQRKNGNDAELFFCKCGIIQKVTTDINYFQIMGIERTFDINGKELSNSYKKFQQQLHPDRYVGKTEDEKLLSDELSSLVNNAYRTLLKPLSRGLYLLKLYGNPLEEGTQATDPNFLMEIMEINEKIADGITELEAKKIWTENNVTLGELTDKLASAFDNNDIEKAKAILVKMKYFTNIEDKLKTFERNYQWESDN